MATSALEHQLVPIKIVTDSTMLRITFSEGTELAVPLEWFPRLRDANTQQRANWRLIGDGEGIHWPDIDEDISISSLLRQPKPVLIRPIHQVPSLIADLYKITRRLEELFKNRPFTPDGHLVGSIGEVVAEYIYDLILEDCSVPQIDAKTRDGRTVQIKLTGAKGRSYGIRWSSKMSAVKPDILLCLQMNEGGFAEIYNGVFPEDLLKGRPDSSNGQISLPLSLLSGRNQSLLAQINNLDEFNRFFTSRTASVA